MKKYSLLFIFAGLLVFTSLAGVSCSRGAATTDDTTDVVDDTTDTTTDTTGDTTDTTGDTTSDTTGDTTDTGNDSGLASVSSIRSYVITEKAKADEAIQSLQGDAQLQLVSLKYINSLSNQTGLATNYYIYSSISNPSFYYMVNAPRNGDGFKRFLMPIEDLDMPFDLMQIPIEYWRLTYAEALAKAETIGGASFRSQHATFEASVILARPAGQYLSWFITYRATDGTGEMLKVVVDANSGDTTVI